MLGVPMTWDCREHRDPKFDTKMVQVVNVDGPAEFALDGDLPTLWLPQEQTPGIQPIEMPGPGWSPGLTPYAIHAPQGVGAPGDRWRAPAVRG